MAYTVTYDYSTPTTVVPSLVLGVSDLFAHPQDRLALCGAVHDPYLHATVHHRMSRQTMGRASGSP
jgi:hypothetical protein